MARMKLTQKKISTLHGMVFDWWKTHRRDLPWRRTHDPYRILVSEVMLQQTQVSRTMPKYEEFLKTFPSVFTLAEATPASVLRAWKGMGYNRRALYLQRAAQMIVRTHKGVFPETESELRKLPGLGIYTARAILVFAFKKEVGMVDTNIRQIITHFIYNDKPQKESIIQETADVLVPRGKSWEWHQALMDFGSLELPKLRITSERLPITRKSIPFKQTNRYYRGRIIDLLRDKHMDEMTLIKLMEKTYGKPIDFIQSIIQGLTHDGLVEKKGTNVQLPE
jgi:A/G-specific adenine glycosylase